MDRAKSAYREADVMQAQALGSRDVLVLERSSGRVGTTGSVGHSGFRLTIPADIDHAVAAVKEAVRGGVGDVSRPNTGATSVRDTRATEAVGAAGTGRRLRGPGWAGVMHDAVDSRGGRRPPDSRAPRRGS
jgi:hypothetical protein